MDFGILYVPNKAASQAAMGLGCFVFLFCILIPYIVCWAFVPLYLILLILGAIRGFKVENPAFTFLFPLVPFAATCVLCMFFWWAIPAIVNFSNDLLDMISPFYDGDILFRDSIPDDKCFLYFIGVLGGSVGSIFSIVSIGILLEGFEDFPKYRTTNDNRAWQEIWIEREFQRNGIGLSYVKPTYQAYKTYTDKKIRSNARDFFSDELSKRHIDQRIINLIWERVSWMFSNNNNSFCRLESAKERQEKQKSLCIRASIDFTPKIKQLRKQYQEGAISKADVMRSLQADFEKWKTEFQLSTNDSNVVCEFLRNKINLQLKQ